MITNFDDDGLNKNLHSATYFPRNGGLLHAVAMMASGWDEGPDKPAPGFPDGGSWTVKCEGLNKAQYRIKPLFG